MEKLKIIIADDHYIFRVGLKRLIGRFPFAGAVDEASNSREILGLLSRSRYDIVLLDADLPGMPALETLELIKEQYPSVKVGLLSTFSNETLAEKFHGHKAEGLLLKSICLPELKRALMTIAEGRQYFSPEIAGKLFSELLHREEKKETEIHITEREKDVLMLICDQCSTEEIAGRLNVSPRTVDRYRENLLGKTASRNSIGLVLFAIKNGIKKV